jgi:HJR/Mrr/RecB family endonuclease
MNDLITKGDIYYNQRQYTQALNYYTAALQQEMRNPLLQVKKGNTFLKLQKKNEAYWCYINALLETKTIDIMDAYFQQTAVFYPEDKTRLKDLLNIKYLLPITHDGFDLLLQRMKQEYDDAQRVQAWKKFEQKIRKKNLYSLQEIIDFFLKEFGEQYPIHFYSFYCYICKFRGFQLTQYDAMQQILNQKKLMELNQFEQLIKRGFRKSEKSLDTLKGYQFEEYLATFFESLGYKVQRTPASHDQGVDLLLNRFGRIIVVQAKRWKKRTVGIASIQQVFTAQKLYHAHRALVISTSRFTKDALKIADKLDVELWDRHRLLDEIRYHRF